MQERVLSSKERECYEQRLRQLEGKVAELRLSRRVLMSLLEQYLSMQRQEMDRVTRENSRLRRQLSSSARQLWQQNGRYMELLQNTNT